MTRRMLAAAPVLAAIAVALAAPDPGVAHEGNPNFRSTVTSAPPVVEASMLNYDDSLQLRVEPGHELVVRGYEDEPYVRFRPDGTVEVNRNSPAYYLNEDRFADVETPDVADAEAKPQWEEAGAHGTYAWHDHRAHYMAQGVPSQVTDESEETKIFDWSVPVELDGRNTEVEGTLTWVGDDGGGAPIVLVAGLGLAVLGSAALAIWRVRRRNRDPEPPSDQEAW
jgi:hypothetical protein